MSVNVFRLDICRAGTGELIIKRCAGQKISGATHDALGRGIKAAFGLIDDGTTAVIGMADASRNKAAKNVRN